MGEYVSGLASVAALATSVVDGAGTGEAGIPAIVFTIVSVVTLLVNTGIGLYKKIREVRREENKKDADLTKDEEEDEIND